MCVCVVHSIFYILTTKAGLFVCVQIISNYHILNLGILEYLIIQLDALNSNDHSLLLTCRSVLFNNSKYTQFICFVLNYIQGDSSSRVHSMDSIDHIWSVLYLRFLHLQCVSTVKLDGYVHYVRSLFNTKNFYIKMSPNHAGLYSSTRCVSWTTVLDISRTASIEAARYLIVHHGHCLRKWFQHLLIALAIMAHPFTNPSYNYHGEQRSPNILHWRLSFERWDSQLERTEIGFVCLQYGVK